MDDVNVGMGGDALPRSSAATPGRGGAALSIGEVARETGVRASAIRYYEAAGVLPATRRVAGRRVYGSEVVDQLAFVRLAQQAGFTVAELRTLVRGFRAGTPPAVRWRALAKRKRAELDALVARAHAMRSTLEAALACRCLTLEECGRRARACPESPSLGGGTAAGPSTRSRRVSPPAR